MIRVLSSVLLFTLVSSFLSVNGFHLMSPLPHAEDRQQLWTQVQQDLDQGLPKSAIEKLKTIYRSAENDEAWAEATLALCQRLITEGQIDQPVYPYAIKQLREALPEAPVAMQPVLKVVLAEWFFNYYRQNQWRFMQRSQTAAVPGDDFATWDLARLLNEVDVLFDEALAEAGPLQQIPIADFDALLEKGNVPDSHRPTLFDFLAFEALTFYSLDEQFIRQQGAFEIRSDSPIFASTSEFLAWTPQTGDEDSYVLKAVRLYQELLRFHADDKDRSAWLDADLHRLLFGRSAAKGSETATRYQAALQRFADDHAEYPLSVTALAHLAKSLQAAGDGVAARKIAEQGQARFPDSVGGRMCSNLIMEIDAKELNVTCERVWNDNTTTLNVNYRNLQEVFFRLIPFDHGNWSRWGDLRSPQNLNASEMERLIQQPAAAAWSAKLPPHADFQTHTDSVPVDVDVKSGCYLLVYSTNSEFERLSTEFTNISMTEVWVSNLALVLRHGVAQGKTQAQVFDATSGSPLPGAEVRQALWKYDGRQSKETDVTTLRTDENGLVTLITNARGLCKLDVSHGDQRLGLIDNVHGNLRDRQGTTERTILFTDRAIYRPGQSIQFKGICTRGNQVDDEYSTLTGRAVTVTLQDANGQEVEQREFRSNEFGSFSGSFTAPRDRVTGVMQLRVTGIEGAAQVRVEEYKRPKFVVQLEKPEAAFRLGQQVTIAGHATAYTGAAVDQSKVVWRVVRTVRYPVWYSWRYWYRPVAANSQEMANGVVQTDRQGKFEISFTAEPDRSVARESEPVFQYVVYADVTDSAGETRSSQQVTSIGYTSLQASLTATDWQTADQPVQLTLKVTTLDGAGQPATGPLKILKLQPPEKIQPAALTNPYRSRFGDATEQSAPDLSNINAWPTAETIHEVALTSDQDGQIQTTVSLPAGAYKAVFDTTDPAGQAVHAELPLIVHNPDANRFPVKIPYYFQARSESVEPGDTFEAVWGSGYDTGRAYVELEHRGNVFQSYWTEAGATQQIIKLPIEEKHRGGLQLRITYVRDNRLYSTSHTIQVPWSNKQLTIKWEHFVSRLQPGGRETWTAVVQGPNAERSVAEMVAAMYDASLDAFVTHSWPASFNLFYRDYPRVNLAFYNRHQYFNNIYQYQMNGWQDANVIYRYFNAAIGANGNSDWGLYWAEGQNTGFGFGGMGGGARFSSRGDLAPQGGIVAESAVQDSAMMAPSTRAAGRSQKNIAGESLSADPSGQASGEGSADLAMDLGQVTARKNLQETAFFYPHLTVAEDGSVRIEFEIPEALTRWKFLGFAHDNELRTALLTDEITTSKDLMVQPNPPRFLREGDLLEFSVKVSNQSDDPQSGSVRLTFADAGNGESLDAAFGNQHLDQTFQLPAKQSSSLFWQIRVPDFVGVLTYKAVGATAKVSDGEEGLLPVLSKRILVTESLPLPIRGNQTRSFDFQRLRLAGESDTLQSQTLTVQMTSNPAWYAVMALPYLMEYPHQCSEQVFNRLYANALGQHIVNSDPRIERIFDQWRATEALDSPLEKNEELRNVLIAESPWLLAGKQESQSRRDVGILFDANRLDAETRRAWETLSEMQLADGAWPWFPGGRANDYITLYVTTGFGRLRHLGIEVNTEPAIRSLDRLDWWIDQQYQELKRQDRLDKDNLSPTICLYLYGRSFFRDDKPLAAEYQTAFNYFLEQGKQHWVELRNRQSQGHLAIALKRWGDRITPTAILKSLTERSLQEDEMGMFWREGDRSWWWYRAPIETQALMIEAFDEVAGDAEKVEELKIWLLKQKQTQNWKTTKATADACYGLLLRGSDQLASDQLVSVSLGGVVIEPELAEAGTGFFEQKFVRGEIQPEMAQIELVKSDAGIAWGSIHWQYLEDVDKVEAYTDTPLTLQKRLFIKQNTDQGPVISEVSGPVQVGDELVMRVELRVDRDMEYVHLKDYRGSGTEPVNVLSQYKFQDGLAYYESTRDTASHFFIDYLPRGTYVFEYSVRVQHRGVYETGIAELQCMYAPEFNSHSASVQITVE